MWLVEVILVLCGNIALIVIFGPTVAIGGVVKGVIVMGLSAEGGIGVRVCVSVEGGIGVRVCVSAEGGNGHVNEGGIGVRVCGLRDISGMRGVVEGVVVFVGLGVVVVTLGDVVLTWGSVGGIVIVVVGGSVGVVVLVVLIVGFVVDFGGTVGGLVANIARRIEGWGRVGFVIAVMRSIIFVIAIAVAIAVAIVISLPNIEIFVSHVVDRKSVV